MDEQRGRAEEYLVVILICAEDTRTHPESIEMDLSAFVFVLFSSMNTSTCF